MSYAAEAISVRVGRATLLDDVSLVVAPGELVAIAGPNGAGKSTLLAALAGDRRPVSGRVTLDGHDLLDLGRDELARRRAVMSIAADVAFAFTAREVVQLGRTPLHDGKPRQSDERVVEALLGSVDCAQLAERVFATLSTGERQRVQLARAVAQVTQQDDGSASRYLLLDEPTSSLDPAHQHSAMRLLQGEAASGLGVIVVVHDLNLAAAYADRIVLMDRARVVASGPPHEILRADLLGSVFAMPMQVIPHPRLGHPLVIGDAGARHPE